MQFPVNFILEIRTQDEYDRVQKALKLLKTNNIKTNDLELIKRSVIKLTNSAKESRVLINGQQIAIGTTEEMIKRYNTECGMHSRSNITMEEWCNGEYTSIRSRRLQKL